jgi:hypothetical protein
VHEASASSARPLPASQAGASTPVAMIGTSQATRIVPNSTWPASTARAATRQHEHLAAFQCSRGARRRAPAAWRAARGRRAHQGQRALRAERLAQRQRDLDAGGTAADHHGHRSAPHRPGRAARGQSCAKASIGAQKQRMGMRARDAWRSCSGPVFRLSRS